MINSIMRAARQVASKIWPSKKYNRINWQNKPSTATALGATNLNKIDVFCNEVDNALIQIDAGKLDIATANSMLASVSFNQETGTFTFKELNGTTYTYDLNLEKIPVSFTLTEDGILIMTTEDGTQWQCNIADLIKDYVFDDSDTIVFEKEFVGTDDEGKGSYHVSASVKAGSINETHLNPDYRADILTYKTQAQEAANDSLDYSKDSKRWAVGDAEYEGSTTDNAKYYKEQAEAAKAAAEEARDEAQAATGGVIMAPGVLGVGKPDNETIIVDSAGTISAKTGSVDNLGVLKPDGITISVDEDGTIHGPSKFESDGYVYVENSDEGTEPAPDPELDADRLGGIAPEGYVKKATDLYAGTDYTEAGEKAADATAIKALNDKFSVATNVGATDTYGILADALGQSNVQALIDEIVDRVMNQLVNKSQIINNLLATQPGNILDAVQGATLKGLIDQNTADIAQLNSELVYYRDTIQKPEIEGITFSLWEVNIKKRGRIVSIQFNVGGSVEKLMEMIPLFTIDEKYRPVDYININYVSQNGNPMLISISELGYIQLYADTAETVSGFFIRQCITFISAS